MDSYRAFLAILISFVILLGYQYFFVGFDKPAPVAEKQEQTAPAQRQETQTPPPQQAATVPEMAKAATAAVQYDRTPKEITVDTDLYTLIITEDGAAVKSFVLKNYKESHNSDSLGMELVQTDASQGLPLQFSWGSAVPSRLLYTSDADKLHLSADQTAGSLHFVATSASGLQVERVYSFNNNSYLMDLSVTVSNNGEAPLQGTPQVHLVNTPFGKTGSPADRFLFNGPATFLNGELLQIKPDDFKDGTKSLQGRVDWAGYEGNYFLCAVLPGSETPQTFTMQGNADLTYTQLAGALDTIQPKGTVTYQYHAFYGPKKLQMLKAIGYNLDKSVNFGWFDVIAKPTLWLLNMFYGVFHNYGIAIILVTVLFKGLFWPISQKGLKSMKNMQKLQPKMAKIKEKYKDDPTKMNQEVMNLYKTYKVNPLGGCLPMVLQIPVFFALYKVLLQSIELRHAPFMLWITDLSAPDRLYLGFDIPYLGGLPVLTLLMGASMFLQQKMSPTTADPTQAKIMMFLPVVFTFMFINFSSGLVLYWFVNNLLSILQQVLINRESKKTAKA
jgi:YidC/Oxa1 family membrane protein insertase